MSFLNIGLSQDFLDKVKIPEIKVPDIKIPHHQLNLNKPQDNDESKAFSGLAKIGHPSPRRSSIAVFGNLLKPEQKQPETPTVLVNQKAMSELFDTMSHHERDVLKDVFERNAVLNANEQSRQGSDQNLGNNLNGSMNSLKSGAWFTDLRKNTEIERKNRALSRRGSVYSFTETNPNKANVIKEPPTRNQQFSQKGDNNVLKPPLPKNAHFT